MLNESYGAAWDQVIARLLSEPDDAVLHVEDHLVEVPRQSGMTRMPLPSDDGRPVYGAFLDTASAFVVHHIGNAYQVKRHFFGSAASTASAARTTPATPQATPEQPTQTSRLAASAVKTEVVETRRLRRFDPDPISPQMNALLVAGMTLAGAGLGAALGGSRGALTGAMIGGGASLSAVAVYTASSSPETAAVAQTLFSGLMTAGVATATGGQIIKMTPVVPVPPLRGWEPAEQPRAVLNRRGSSRR